MYNLICAVQFKGIVLDFILILFILALIGNSRRTSAKKQIINFFYTVGSFVIALLLCAKFITFIDGRFDVIEKTQGFFSKILTKIFSPKIMNTTINQAMESGSLFDRQAAQIIKFALSVVQGTDIDINVTVNQVVTPYIAYYCLIAVSFLVLFGILKFTFYVAIKNIEDDEKKNESNNAAHSQKTYLSAIFGGVYAIFIIYALLFIVSILPTNWVQFVLELIDSSLLAKFMSKYNVIRYVIELVANPDYIIKHIINSLKYKAN